VRARKLVDEVRAAKRDRKEEAQSRSLAVQLRRLGVLFDLM
jgi:hypothetical protein